MIVIVLQAIEPGVIKGTDPAGRSQAASQSPMQLASASAVGTKLYCATTTGVPRCAAQVEGSSETLRVKQGRPYKPCGAGASTSNSSSACELGASATLSKLDDLNNQARRALCLDMRAHTAHIVICQCTDGTTTLACLHVRKVAGACLPVANSGGLTDCASWCAHAASRSARAPTVPALPARARTTWWACSTAASTQRYGLA